MQAEAAYGRSQHGLWVRARAELDDVVVEAQERVAVRGGMAVGIGADGERRWECPATSAPAPGTWYEVARIAFGAPWEALEVPMLDWPRVVRGVQRHVALLVAAGWGDTVAEVASWFQDPLAGETCIVPSVYRVEEEYGVLRGFGGVYLRADPVADGRGRGRVLGTHMPDLEVAAAPWVLAMVVGAVPVSE